MTSDNAKALVILAAAGVVGYALYRAYNAIGPVAADAARSVQDATRALSRSYDEVVGTVSDGMLIADQAMTPRRAAQIATSPPIGLFEYARDMWGRYAAINGEQAVYGMPPTRSLTQGYRAPDDNLEALRIGSLMALEIAGGPSGDDGFLDSSSPIYD